MSPSWGWCGGSGLRCWEACGAPPCWGAVLQHCGTMAGVREWEVWQGEKLVAVPPNCSPTSVPERAKSCLELHPWGRCLVLSSPAAAPGPSPQLVNLKGSLLCFDSVRLPFDVRAIHLPPDLAEDARAVLKLPERGREALGTVPIGAEERWDGVAAGLGPQASGPAARLGGRLGCPPQGPARGLGCCENRT